MRYPEINPLQETAVTPKTKGTKDEYQNPGAILIQGAETPVKGLPKRPPDEPCRRGYQLQAGTMEEGQLAGVGPMMWTSRWD